MRFLAHAFLFMAFSLLSVTVRAEYRAYQLAIEDQTTGQKRSVITTLDHMQYAEYHPIRSTETVVIEDHWMCRNRTDISQDPYQRICPNPRAPSSGEQKTP